ncbi:hypothetical protein [Mucilaginibacter sp. L3T2-6]|uniref:hypothetical protein n=1 Tax=Mucilaginibacter sp. L3T2-6 TaxID=3062491 RepID=UPI00267548CE|nr:hypothetical protein [Mucilaginibacter sp. L3T2-6]MDO3643751.1 hypothetical protein [Mucilaginibacter sp. L3T2-6]MDV6216202.1 hypothetical protein [Mucilaginibacter sp. L3T2-6]
MKKFIAIGFLAVFLLSATDAYQLLKLPYIFEHFAEHHKLDRHLSFAAFLDIHYVHGSPKDKDYEEDMKLPFKSTDKCPVNQSVVFVLPAGVTISTKPLELVPHGITFYRDRFIPGGYFSGIWQPPQFC